MPRRRCAIGQAGVAQGQQGQALPLLVAIAAAGVGSTLTTSPPRGTPLSESV